jgi:DNA-binding HxlR family transcriptional regulator
MMTSKSSVWIISTFSKCLEERKCLLTKEIANFFPKIDALYHDFNPCACDSWLLFCPFYVWLDGRHCRSYQNQLGSVRVGQSSPKVTPIKMRKNRLIDHILDFMTRVRVVQNQTDHPIDRSLKIMGQSYALHIMRNMILLKQNMFNQFLNSIEGINTKTLSIRLQKLEDYGLVERGDSRQTSADRILPHRKRYGCTRNLGSDRFVQYKV